MHSSKGFAGLGLKPHTLDALSRKGFENPTPVQSAVIPVVLRNKTDLIVQSRTGSGKTGAFGIPMADRWRSSQGGPFALVLVPTRELALQVGREIVSFFSDGNGRSVAIVYGGTGYQRQKSDLSVAKVIVATPGRLLDFIRSGLQLGKTELVVLDEADEMLKLGFQEDLESILNELPEKHRTLLFSATMPAPIRNIARQHMQDPEHITIENAAGDTGTSPTISQYVVPVYPEDRQAALLRVLATLPDFYGIIFCNMKADADEVNSYLQENRYPADALHGDISQKTREIILSRFRRKIIRVLVATDVAARGIDIPDLSHIINYNLPDDLQTYVHRIGRTGRAGKSGAAISLVTPSRKQKIRLLARLTGKPMLDFKLPHGREMVRAASEILELKFRNLPDAGKNTTDLATKILESDDAVKIVGGLIEEWSHGSLSEDRYPALRQPDFYLNQPERKGSSSYDSRRSSGRYASGRTERSGSYDRSGKSSGPGRSSYRDKSGKPGGSPERKAAAGRSGKPVNKPPRRKSRD